MKAVLKKIIPAGWLSVYHKSLAMLGSVVYGHPSRKMIVVGITGTKGKSTTANMLWKMLTDAGHTVGLTGTINIRIGAEDHLNTSKMSMVGRFQMQKLLRQMVKAGCDVAIIETTSEGIAQWRHIGIHYDVCAFTNLTPEHIDSHGSFENYKKAKLELFHHLASLPRKVINGKEIVLASVGNNDSEHVQDFLSIGDHVKKTVGSGDADISYSNVEESLTGTLFEVDGLPAYIPLLGKWNVSNAVLAMGIGSMFELSSEQMVASLRTMDPVPGRMEFIDEGQPFFVIVDYAHEPTSLRLLFEFCRKRIESDKRIITLSSSTGGGRDVSRRFKNGQLAGELCDLVVVTDEDPYDDDPQEIINEVAKGVLDSGKVEGENFWKVLDRREGIAKAISLAREGDVVLIPSKGAEQKMVVAGGRHIDWDDRQVVRDIIRK